MKIRAIKRFAGLSNAYKPEVAWAAKYRLIFISQPFLKRRSFMNFLNSVSQINFIFCCESCAARFWLSPPKCVGPQAKLQACVINDVDRLPKIAAQNSNFWMFHWGTFAAAPTKTNVNFASRFKPQVNKCSRSKSGRLSKNLKVVFTTLDCYQNEELLFQKTFSIGNFGWSIFWMISFSSRNTQENSRLKDDLFDIYPGEFIWVVL